MALSKRTLNRVLSTAFQTRYYSAPAERLIPAAKQKYVPTSGTYPKGFLAGSSHAGVKPSNTKYDDVALVVSEQPCSASAVFTRNFFQAAPILASQRIIKQSHGDKIRGVVVNSGCANAVTGKQGFNDAMSMAITADKCFEADESFRELGKRQEPKTLVMSTGVIGQPLPIEKIQEAIPKAHAALGSTHDHWLSAAQAICTTDTFPKLLSRTFNLPSHPETEYRIAGMTKGAGMIHPNMGTLLAIICTDAKLAPSARASVLKITTDFSFNCISIDGDTSTNDTVALLANGAAAPEGIKPMTFRNVRERAFEPSEDAKAFLRVLKEFMKDLAKLVVRDGEGATKFVTIRVLSDVSIVTARRVATSIATSNLVKTALYGKDANWGRILCAVGYAPGIMNNPGLGLYSESIELETADGMRMEDKHQLFRKRTSVSFIPADGSEELKLLVRDEPQQVDEDRAREILEMEVLEIFVRLQDDGDFQQDVSGKPPRKTHEATFYTCDFSHEYVTINGDYRT